MAETVAKSKGEAKKPKKILRVDRLEQQANRGKQRLLVALLSCWRETAGRLAAEQWRLFYENGKCNSKHVQLYPDCALGGARVQMARFQVAGVINGYLQSLADKFKQRVNNSSLSAEKKHRLHRINRSSAWYWQEKPAFKQPPQVEDSDILLARQIFRHLLKHHRKPNFSRINAVLDKRTVRVEQAKAGSQFHYWLNVATLEKQGRGYLRVAVPLKSNPFAESRPGEHSTTWQMNVDRDGELYFGRLTNVAAKYEKLKAAYEVRTPELALDWGLNTLFASSEGDLLGRNFLDRLKAYDKVICGIARHQQRQGLKPRDSQRYCAKVDALRGLLKTEVNRVLNRLVDIRAPGHLILEKLDFRNSQLSRRLNRILRNAGRRLVQAKLDDLEERYGITHDLGNAAYSSQECNSTACGYVDRKNRKGDKFHCRACGKKQHADVKAAKVMLGRCSSEKPKLPLGRAALLDVLIRGYIERYKAPRWKSALRPRHGGMPLDPRLDNRHFADWTARVRLHHGARLSS